MLDFCMIIIDETSIILDVYILHYSDVIVTYRDFTYHEEGGNLHVCIHTIQDMNFVKQRP